MKQLTLFKLSNDILIAGLDVRDDGSVRVAFVNYEAVDYPNTTDLRRCSTLRSFERFWDRRFNKHNDQQLIVALTNPDPPGLVLWFAERHIAVVDLDHHNLTPFIQESADYETPLQYRRAHALAQCAAIKLNTPRQIRSLHAALLELNFYLRDVEKGLQRLAVACTPP